MSAAKKATKSGAKKRRAPFPGKESRKVFSAALALAKELLVSKGLRIDLDQTGNVEFVINSEKLKAIPKDKFKDGLTRDYFPQLMATEFESLVRAATYSDSTLGLQSEIPSEILSEKGEDEFLWRLEEVKKVLVPTDLRDRAILRRTTQGLVLQDITWQVAIKKQDQVKGKLSDIPYGSLSIVYASPQTSVSSLRLKTRDMSVEFPALREPKQLILELHQADVAKMIETLTALRENLEKVKKAK